MTCDIDVADMEPGTRLRAYLPYPLTTDSQRDVQLVGCEPPSLASGLLPEFGYVYGSEFSVQEAPRVTVSYTAEWTGYEIHSHGLMQSSRPSAPSIPLEDLLNRLTQGELDPVTKAWLIYDWMVTHGRFEKSWNPCLCLPCCARDFARDRVGHCIVLAHAFIAYCERVGVRARPVRGSMFTHARDDAGRRFGIAALGEPVIGHTWAEFEAPGLGWLPVEFHAIVFKSTPHRNGRDEALGVDRKSVV